MSPNGSAGAAIATGKAPRFPQLTMADSTMRSARSAKRS